MLNLRYLEVYLVYAGCSDRCSQFRSIWALKLSTQLLHVKAILEVKYLVRGAKKLL